MDTEEMQNAPEKELRIGLVLYGGVSLAIYIFGVVYELLRLVRKEGAYEEVVREAGVKPVIDVISGSSAGGINGLFLAKALATGARLDPLKTLWIKEGDFSDLLDQHSAKPPSLLDSEGYVAKLERALNGLDEDARSKAAPMIQRVLDLFITATDLDGIGLRHEDLGLDSKHYNTVFHFKVRPDDPLAASALEAQPEAFDLQGQRGEISPKTRFSGPDANRFLARVAASTSAFPVAFAPMKFTAEDKQQMRALFGDALFPDMANAPSVYGDGGMVDNAPFSYTIGTIFRRHAAAPVDRKLVFVEPDPETPEKRRIKVRDRDGLDSLVSYLGVSFYESITADLRRIESQNSRLRAIQKALLDLEDKLDAFLDTHPQNQLRAGYHESVLFETYCDLKKQDIVQSLWTQARDAGVRIEQAALQDALDAAFEDKTREDFFLAFDCGFRVRRLRYFIQWVNRVFAHAALTSQQHAALCEFKAALYGVIERYTNDVWQIWEQVRNNAEDLGANPARLVAVLMDKFKVVMSDGLKQHAKKKVDAFLSDPLLADLKDQLPPDRLFEAFEFFDMYLFPVVKIAGVGEADLLEVIRISPRDADRYSTSVADKLAGEKMAHFSAFLKESWRRNDILWGRLDAAQLIAEKLLGLNAAATERFLNAICPQIILEEVENRTQVAKELATLGDVRYMQSVYAVGKEGFGDIPKPYAVETVSRSVRTVGRLVLRLSDKTPPKFAGGVERMSRSINRTFETLANLLSVFGGASTPMGERITAFSGLSVLVTLALWAVNAIEIHAWPIWGAAALIVGYWIFGALWLFAGTLTLTVITLLKSGALTFPDLHVHLSNLLLKAQFLNNAISFVVVAMGLFASVAIFVRRFQRWRRKP